MSGDRDLIQPKPDIVARAHISSMQEYRRLYRLSLDDPETFWGRQAAILDWFHPWRTVFDHDYENVDFGWYLGGRLNACYNCVDRHLKERGDRTAIIWAKDEPGEYERITYRELKHRVARVANVLRHHGVRKGDRVCLYMPMIPDLAVAMLACARIGAVHSIVFGGLQQRVAPRPHPRRRRQGGHHRQRGAARGQAAAPEGDRRPRRRRARPGRDRAGRAPHAAEVAMKAGRDLWLDEECRKQRSTCTVEWMGAEDPLFILYTSGSTGKPKGVLHTTGGYLVYAAMTHKLVFDYHHGDIYFCAADIGWITGHTYIIYGPLANGATTVMFESIPTYPDAGRYWRIVDDLGVNIFYTAPTALRAIHRGGDAFVADSRRDTLRILGTVGEPINPETWRWYHDVVGGGRCDVVDTWWQTETGGILITPLPGVTPMKPGSATLPFFGVSPCSWTSRAGAGRRRRRRQPLPRADVARARPAPSTATTSASTRPTSRSTRASTSPATAAAATRTATTGSPAASTTSSTSAATAWAPPRSRARWSRTRSWPRPRWSATRTRSRGRASSPTCWSTPRARRWRRTSWSACSRSRCGT